MRIRPHNICVTGALDRVKFHQDAMFDRHIRTVMYVPVDAILWWMAPANYLLLDYKGWEEKVPITMFRWW